MHRIEHSVSPKTGPQRGRLKFPGDFGVVRTTELPKFLHRVVLPHLQRHSRPCGQLIDHFFLFWQELIGLVELLRGGVVEPDHLHGADFKAIAQNRIYYLSD